MKKKYKKFIYFGIIIIVIIIIIFSIISSTRGNDIGLTSKNFDDVMEEIKDYLQTQRDYGYLELALEDGSYNIEVATGYCIQEYPCDGKAGDFINLLGYANDIDNIIWYEGDSGKVSIMCVSASPKGRFPQSSNYERCN